MPRSVPVPLNSRDRSPPQPRCTKPHSAAVDSPAGSVACVQADTPGDGEPTEVEVEADRELATQVVIASLTGFASLISIYAGAAAVAFAPIALASANAAVRRMGWRRIEHATDTLTAGAEAAGVSVAEFTDKAASDDRHHELFVRALTVAQDTAWRNKRRALGKALANGVMGDEARIDEELLFVRAVDDIDEMHVRLLDRFASGGQLTAREISQADPGLGDAVLALLGRLESQGLIDSRSPVTPGGAMTPEPRYFITRSGQDFLARLADDLPELEGGREHTAG
jgi:hypothetical protein